MENVHCEISHQRGARYKDAVIEFTEQYLTSLGMKTKVWESDKETLISGKKLLCEVGVKIVIKGDDLLVGVGQALWKDITKGGILGLIHPGSGVTTLLKCGKDFLMYQDIANKIGDFLYSKDWDYYFKR